MKKYLLVLGLLLVGLCLIILGLSLVEGQAQLSTEAWCEQMMTLPNVDWTQPQAQRFSAECLVE